MAMEVKLLAIEALEAGLSPDEVAELVSVGTATIYKWRKDHSEGGVQRLCRKASSIAVRGQCTALEQKIVAHRREHPERGVRRIRDDLRRDEALEVSAEKVRTVVNEAGLGNPPPTPHRRGPQIRRFERSCPNAMWQIDIFTFQLKRMYPVYLIGIIDDHSRYLVGWGLFRQQNAEAVLEVLKGAIGQWGAPREILSDNGRQFVAWRGQSRFQKVLQSQGVQHVRSAPQHPMTLGKIERFWQTIWREFLAEAVFASFADACQRLDHWIHYYNHQRPHQGIDGACPADRFYGIAEDVEEAVKQGCQENSLRLALGQEPQPPLYLLGQLGATDVRVVRKGEHIEVKVGDAVHEVIRMGAPFAIGEDGSFGRVSDEVEGPERPGALPGGGAGAQGRGGGERAVQELRDEPADAVPGDGGGRPGGGPGLGAEEAWPQAEGCERDRDERAGGEQAGAQQGARALEDEVPGGADAAGPGAQAGEGPAASWGEGGEKNQAGPGQGSDAPSFVRPGAGAGHKP
ncbi:MAG: DDE-type integrase/transposase/recombinase [Gammaproteobacteria bacterium]|nr:DDE-type integrase/transposase/recombinase [Gammaproteobacteria bacterium]